MEEKIYTIEEIKRITRPIFEEYGIEKAYIFGSYARGDRDINSDIDIMIVAKKIKSLLVIGELLETLKEKLKKQVDLIEEECFEQEELDDIDNDFYEKIKGERVIIYG